MHRILVTGCAGYVGSVTCQELLSDPRFSVVGIDNLMYDNALALSGFIGDSRFSFHRMDVRDTEDVLRVARDCDAVIHLAALVGAPICQGRETLAERVNHTATAKLSKGLSRQQRLIYPNTNSGYGRGDGNRPVTEEDALRPLSSYASTKCSGEAEVLDHPLGVSFRLATVFGVSPRMRFDLMVNDFTLRLSELISLFKTKAVYEQFTYTPMVLFEPNFNRNYVHVRDVANALSFALVDHRLTGAYNLGHPEANLSKYELAMRVLEVLKAPFGRYVVEGDGEDPDQRDYRISNDKMLGTGFVFKHSLNYGIDEVAKFASLLRPEQIKRMRNL